MKKAERDAMWDVFDDMKRRHLEENHNTFDLSSEVDNFVIDKIAAALKESAGNQTRAAKKLGISRECLIYKIKKYF